MNPLPQLLGKIVSMEADGFAKSDHIDNDTGTPTRHPNPRFSFIAGTQFLFAHLAGKVEGEMPPRVRLKILEKNFYKAGYGATKTVSLSEFLDQCSLPCCKMSASGEGKDA